jgi:hypothetical protein
VPKAFPKFLRDRWELDISAIEQGRMKASFYPAIISQWDSAPREIDFSKMKAVALLTRGGVLA